MKKKILSLAVVLCLMMAMLPVTAKAGLSVALYVGNTHVSAASSTPVYWKAAGAGEFAYADTGTSDDYLFSVSFDSSSSTYTLTLNGVDITNCYNYCGIFSAGNLNIMLADGKKNTITVPGISYEYYGIRATGELNISGGGSLDVTVNSDESYDSKFGLFSNSGITITDGKVSVVKNGRYGDAVRARNDIRILGEANVYIVDWSKGDGVACGLHSNNGNVAIGGSASLNICSQSKGIYAGNTAFIGYVWDNAKESYVQSGSPTVTINDASAIAAITPDTADDFTTGEYGVWADMGISVCGGTIAVSGQNGIYSENGGIAISGSDTEVTIRSKGDEKDSFLGIRSGTMLTITDAKVDVYQSSHEGHGIFTNGDIRIFGSADVYVENGGDKDSFGFYCNDDVEVFGNIVIGGNAQVKVCSQAVGLITFGRVYIGYVWDEDASEYIADGNPTVKINNDADVAAITPEIQDDFGKVFIGLYGIASINMAGGSLEAAGTEAAVISLGTISYKGSILAAKYGYYNDDEVFIEVPIEDSELDIITLVIDELSTFRYIDDPLTYIKIGAMSDINKGESNGGSFTVKVNGEDASSALSGETVTLSATPNSGYSFSSWNVYKLNDSALIIPVTDNTFIMPSYAVYVGAEFSADFYDITKAASTGGSFTVKVNNVEAESAMAGDTVKLSATPDSGYRHSGWSVYRTDNDTIFINVSNDTFTMSTYSVTVDAKFIKVSSGGHSTPPAKTIEVTETSSDLFKGSKGTVKAEANVNNAFSDSVEVKVKDTNEDGSNFGLGAGNTVYPFDISLYIKGTNNKTQPKDGYTVTIYLPIPSNLLDVKEQLFLVHKSDSGEITRLKSELKQINGVWYLVFEASEFSPYALVVGNASSYNESAGVPYYLDSNGKEVFIGFAANGKYIAPSSATVLFKKNAKSFIDVSGHWAADYISFAAEREIFVGTGLDTFSPDSGMTRAMFATVIGRLYERSYGQIEASDARTFSDCSNNDYYGKYVDWCEKNNIITGVGGGLFEPDREISREEMAAILFRFAGFAKVIPQDLDQVLNYPDRLSISDWAENAALYCQSTGIISGSNGGNFVPKGIATRAEVAAIMQRFIENVLK